MVSSKFAALTASLALCALPQSALSADYPDTSWPDDMRGSYNWGEQSEWDAVGFEASLRYVYSVGHHEYSVGNTKETSDDTSHILEGNLRIEDYSTSSFLNTTVGYSIAINGSYSGDWGSGNIVDGSIGYGTIDLGRYFFGDPRDGFGVGGFIGYQYLSDNPDIGRANFTTASSAADINWSTASNFWTVPYDSKPNQVDIHMLRLGASVRAELNDAVDFDVDVAAIPFAGIGGTLGAFAYSNADYGSYALIQSSPVDLSGWGYGATADVAIGFHPTDNMIVRLGGKAQYLQGTYDATYSVATITDPVDTTVPPDGTYDGAPTFSNQGYITTDNPFSQWRLGAMLELGVSF